MKPEQTDLVGRQINCETPQHVREATDKYETGTRLIIRRGSWISNIESTNADRLGH
jgi:hypothetical protein